MRYLFKLTEIALTVLVLHHLMFSNLTMDVTNPVFITSVVYMSQPTLDMLWSVPFYVCKRYAQPLNRPKIALTVLLLHHFSFSILAVKVTKPAVITLIGWLSQPILDML